MTALFPPSTPNRDFATSTILMYGYPKSGKCLQFGTLVMMADGTNRKVEDIQNGEHVMGLNGRPALVLGHTTGHGPLYRVTQNKGVTYTVNGEHVLALSYNGKKRNITVGDYFLMPAYLRTRHKGYKSRLDLPATNVRIDPYFLGVWLGDGTSASIEITTPDPEIQNAVTDYAISLGLRITLMEGEKCPRLRVVGDRNGSKGHGLLDAFKNLDLLNNKHIPRSYLFNSAEVRRAVLAGLIDTDGHNNNGKCVEIITKFDQLSDDILWLARSLGFRATHRIKRGTIKALNFEADYHRIFLAGDFTKLPMLLKRKIPTHTNARDPLITGIQVERVADGDWAGFHLEGDHLFLLSDFTVTHNTTLMSHFADKRGRKPLFLMTEDGQGELPLANARFDDWDGFLRMIAHVEKHKAQLVGEHCSFIWDIVSDIDEMCSEFICKQQHVRTLGELEHGKGWDLQSKELKAAHRRLSGILPVSFIAHSDERELTWDTEKVKMQCPVMAKRCLKFVNGKVDTIMWIAPATSKREYPEVIIKNTLTCIAGSRHPQLVGSWKMNPANVAATAAAIQLAFESAPLPTIPVPAIVAASDSPATPTP